MAGFYYPSSRKRTPFEERSLFPRDDVVTPRDHSVLSAGTREEYFARIQNIKYPKVNMTSVGQTIGGGFPAWLSVYWRRLATLFLPSPTTLLSPIADIFMAGGASIAFFFIVNYFVAEISDFNAWAIAVYYAAFLVNYPHFASSYQLLYRDGRRGFFSFSENKLLSLKLWWAGLIVPAILIGYFFFALSSANTVLMGYIASAMYFFVGWHYVKQIYGCMIVLSSANKVYFNTVERWSTLATLYSLWAVSYIASNQGGGSNVYYQITYPLGDIPEMYLYGALGFMGAALFTMFAAFVYKYIHERQHPPLSALTAFISIFLWFFPFYLWFDGLSNRYFFYVVPFFHSLQYLLFVIAYKRNWSLRETYAPRGVTLLENAPAKVLGRITLFAVTLFVVLPIAVIALLMKREGLISVETLYAKWLSDLSVLSPTILQSALLFFGGVTIVLGLVWWWARKNPYGKFSIFFLNAYVLGLLLFALIPNSLDVLSRNELLPTWMTYDTKIFGTALYLYFFTLFINIHHYFIDNVIWRRDNPHIREYIFTR